MQRFTATSVVLATNAALLAATISVFESGSEVLAEIFEDTDGSTPQANPFTSSATSGVFSFCAADGLYDILISKTGATSYTISQVSLSGIGTSILSVLTADPAAPLDDTAWIFRSGDQISLKVRQDGVTSTFPLGTLV